MGKATANTIGLYAAKVSKVNFRVGFAQLQTFSKLLLELPKRCGFCRIGEVLHPSECLDFEDSRIVCKGLPVQ